MRSLINAVVSVAILSSCVYAFYALGERAEPERKPPPRPSGVLVETIPIRQHQGPVRLTANGTVVPFREIRMTAQVSGKVIEHSPNLRPGFTVKQGDILVKLDPAEYHLEVRRLQQQQAQDAAELDALTVQVDNTANLVSLAEQELELQQNELRRIESLGERQATTQSDVDAARRAELTAKNALVRLQNQTRELQSQQLLIEKKQNLTQVLLERAQLDESRTVVKSPISGVVVQSSVEDQNYLQPGTPFAIIEDTSAMEVNCNLTLDEMYWIWNDIRHQSEGQLDVSPRNGFELPPTPVTVRFDIGERSYAWSGILSRQGEAGLDERTRTIPCRVHVDQPRQVRMMGGASEDYASNDGPRTLMRGMFVTVEIECAPHRELLAIPEQAIRPGKRLWIAENDKLRLRPIEVVGRDNEFAIIDAVMGNIAPGDQLIISPVANVREGLPLQTGKPDGPPNGKPDLKRPPAAG